MYNVGDILWIISQDRPGVIPYRVIEEVTKKTLNGTTTQYIIEIPGSSKNKSRLLKEEDDVYTSVENVKKELLLRAEDAIDRMLKHGTEIIERSDIAKDDTSNFSVPASIESSKNKELVAEPVDTYATEFVTLPDGTKAKINIKGDIP